MSELTVATPGPDDPVPDSRGDRLACPPEELVLDPCGHCGQRYLITRRELADHGRWRLCPRCIAEQDARFAAMAESPGFQLVPEEQDAVRTRWVAATAGPTPAQHRVACALLTLFVLALLWIGLGGLAAQIGGMAP